MDECKRKAEAFTLSYKRAMELSLAAQPDRAATAAALAAHYSPAFHSFALGSSTAVSAAPAFPGQQPPSHAAVVEHHLAGFDKAGFGWRMRLESYKIEPYSDTSAQCWLTWAIEPKESSGVEPWQWTNIYGYRSGVKGDAKEGDKEEGFWEYAVSDHEIANLLQRCPNFFAQ